jgi:hypothetical protein
LWIGRVDAGREKEYQQQEKDELLVTVLQKEVHGGSDRDRRSRL